MVTAVADRRIAVLGAGALGLTAALRLTQRGDNVTVFERESSPEGLAAGFQPGGPDGPWLEKFYHHLFQSDHRAIALIHELGLGPDLSWHRPRTVVLRDGRLHQLDSADVPAPISPAPDLGSVPDGSRSGLPQGPGQPATAGGRARGSWIRGQMGHKRGRRGLGPAPSRQVRRRR